MNFYKLLEVDRQASPEVIKQAYRALALRHHPDRHPGDNSLNDAQMRLINEAYEVLSDPLRREAYDRPRRYWDIWLDEGLLGLVKEL